MPSNYEPIGGHIRLVDIRNKALEVERLVGLSISKKFIPSVANTVGTNMANYKIIKKGQFACSIMQVRRDGKMPVALMQEYDEAIISQAYPVFEIIDETKLLPEYLMMWMSRSEFDRHACFLAVGGVRGSLEWDDFLEMELPVQHIDIQRAMVKEYNTITNRIKLNEQLNQQLEETAQTLYRHWFVDFEFPYDFETSEPSLEGQPYKSNGGEMVWCEELEKEIPKGWGIVELESFCQSDSPITYGVVKPGPEDENGVKFVRSGELSNGFIQEQSLRTITVEVSNQYKRTVLKGGEVLIGIVGNPGAVAMVPTTLIGGNIARQVALVRCQSESDSLFLKGYLTSELGKRKLEDATTGSVQQVINLKDLRPLPVLKALPIVIKSFNLLAEKVNNTMNRNREEVNLLLRMKSVILSKMSRVETGVAGHVGVG